MNHSILIGYLPMWQCYQYFVNSKIHPHLAGGRVLISGPGDNPQPIISFIPNGKSSCVYCSPERTTDTRFLYSPFQSTYILDMYWYIQTVQSNLGEKNVLETNCLACL